LYDEKAYKKLLSEGVDETLAKHIAHLFIRDPLVIYSDKIKIDDEKASDHFENIQSTNWQTMRFKPPPPGSNIGWRVEFRSMEAQVTDFENAAFVIFIVLLTRTILSRDLNFYLPISKSDENMKKAYKRGATQNEKFYFRKNVFDSGSCQLGEMSINQIINGDGEFPGLIPLIENYLDSMDVDFDTRCHIGKYLKLVSQRASGKLKNTATFVREFVTSHKDYKFDSKVSEKINFDLMKELDEISKGNKKVPDYII